MRGDARASFARTCGSVYVLRMRAARAKTDVLILAAHELELAGVRTWLGPSLAGKQHGRWIACESVGVGMPAAAVGTMHALRTTRPRAVVLLGSCGVYAAREARLLSPAVPRVVQLVDAASVARQAALPAPMPVKASAHARLSAGLARGSRDAVRGSAATTLGITTSDALARKLARASGCAFENLEALAVALACQREDVPFAALLVVTNVVGRQGRRQWLAHCAAAAERGGHLIERWLARGAPGLP